MSRVVQVIYSPVCDLSAEAYGRYLDCLQNVVGGAECTVVSVSGASVSDELGSGVGGPVGRVSSDDFGDRDDAAVGWRVVRYGDTAVGRRFLEDLERGSERGQARVGRAAPTVAVSSHAGGGSDGASGDGVCSDVALGCDGQSTTTTGGSTVRSTVPVSVGVESGRVASNVQEQVGGSSQRVVVVEEVTNDGREECGRYVPPHARARDDAGVVRGKHYAANKATRERRKAARKLNSSRVEESPRGSSFAACTQEQREGLQRTRALRLMAENKLKAAEAELKFVRLQAEREFALKDVDSGAYVNRIQMRNEALDKKWQDQAENVQSYRRSGPVQGWVKTVVSGEGSGPSSPRSVPTLSSGGSPRSESDWELEVKRRDDENAQLRLELRALIAENDGVLSCGDHDSRNFNQLEHYGSTDDGAEKAVPWDQDSQLLRLREQMREPMFRGS